MPLGLSKSRLLVECKTDVLERTEHIDESGQDPRRAFTENLLAMLGEQDPVFVYHQGFEGGCLR